MSGSKIRPEEFADALYKALAKYGDDVLQITDACAKKSARETKADLKASAPAGGSYARGWSNRAMDAGSWGTRQFVFNRTDYQLIHLLEKPHATGGGGYYPKNVDYTGTIAKIEEKNTNKYLEEVLRKI